MIKPTSLSYTLMRVKECLSISNSTLSSGLSQCMVTKPCNFIHHKDINITLNHWYTQHMKHARTHTHARTHSDVPTSRRAYTVLKSRSPSVPLWITVMVFVSVVISAVSGNVRLVTWLVGVVMTVTFMIIRLSIITAIVIIFPLVFVVVVFLEMIVLQFAVTRLNMTVFNFLYLRREKKKRVIYISRLIR